MDACGNGAEDPRTSYALRMAAVTAGADALLAAALDAAPEPLPEDWEAVQGSLAADLLHPRELLAGDPAVTAAFSASLARANEAAGRSDGACVLAKGSETALARLWHISGAKCDPPRMLGVASLVYLAVQEKLFSDPFSEQDAAAAAPGAFFSERRKIAESIFPSGDMSKECRHVLALKSASDAQVRSRLLTAARRWNRIRDALDAQLMYWPRMQAMLKAAGLPTTPEEIGLSPERISASVLAMPFFFRRYGLADLAFETGRIADCAMAVLERWKKS